MVTGPPRKQIMGIQQRKEREFLRREREILDSARVLLGADDWLAVTVEQIAEHAEIGKGTVYKHFASKDEIYARLAMEFQVETVNLLEQIDSSRPVMQRLRATIGVFWEQHRKAETYQRLVQYCEREDFRRRLPPDVQESLAELDGRFKAQVNGVLQAGIDQGLLPQKPLKALVLGPMAALTGAVRMLWRGALGAETKQGQHLEEITNFILAGMLYQEWLADEGLDEEQASRRAEAELREGAEPL
jgi:AcrR family transcriptional regulator